ncbi:uncharacterized protein SPSK_10330 [Sporothrix schenckii 1099-18]|uniref:Uncharacterized protein n=1 Tax=Sporothrix schenckii 1099-18 TaxID=1397361 RepID=A0A0F2LTD2_SPOSC|nr:uncharacterized protein SPSK_10330 [Sporothrix schenckii 1099-18]KJR80114.1 hypothetical protein SPSK_10330 [Sporothrix schenckii 1099-18]
MEVLVKGKHECGDRDEREEEVNEGAAKMGKRKARAIRGERTEGRDRSRRRLVRGGADSDGVLRARSQWSLTGEGGILIAEQDAANGDVDARCPACLGTSLGVPSV